jgi:hypothetical protein
MSESADCKFQITKGLINPLDISQNLQDFAKVYPIGQRGMIRYGRWKDRKFAYATIIAYFDTWANAMKSANVDYARSGSRRVDPEKLEFYIRKFCDAHPVKRRTLGGFELWTKSLSLNISSRSIKPVFGNWHGALVRFGIECPARSRSVKHSDEECLVETEKVWRWAWVNRNRSPRIQDFKDYIAIHTDGIGDAALRLRFGRFDRYLAEFSDFKNGRISRQAVLDLHPKSIVRRDPISKRDRFDLIQEAGKKCAACGRANIDGITLHIDHIVPVSMGGKSDRPNLQVLCGDCNLGRGARYSS